MATYPAESASTDPPSASGQGLSPQGPISLLPELLLPEERIGIDPDADMDEDEDIDALA